MTGERVSDFDSCRLCGGTGEIECSTSDSVDVDCFGCPMCMSREFEDERSQYRARITTLEAQAAAGMRAGLERAAVVAVQSWTLNSAIAAIYAELARLPAPATDERAKALEDAAAALFASRLSTFKRRGKDVGIEDEDGEKCWIVPFQEMFDLENSLAALKDITS